MGKNKGWTALAGAFLLMGAASAWAEEEAPSPYNRGGSHRGAQQGVDPYGTEMMVSVGIGPFQTVGGGETDTVTSNTPYGNYGGSGSAAYGGGMFTLPASFEWNADGMGASGYLGYGFGSGIWTGTNLGYNSASTVSQGQFMLGGEFDFAPIKSRGLFFGFGPAIDLRTLSESFNIDCGNGYGAGTNTDTRSATFFRIGAGARLRYWVNKLISIRGNVLILPFALGGGSETDTCPGSGSISYSGSFLSPLIVVEPGIGFRINDLFSIGGYLGVTYQNLGLSYSTTAGGYTANYNINLGYTAINLLPRAVAEFNF